jgi:hypothetical protein
MVWKERIRREKKFGERESVEDETSEIVVIH